jgi:fucose 4-O-acetylase-like acetyltransferase
MELKNRYIIKNTLGMFDLIKGITMIMVMFFHTYGLWDILEQYQLEDMQLAGKATLISIYVFLAFIGTALMPVLFIASGYNFRKTSLVKCIKKQVKSLLIPYLITGAMVVLVDFAWTYLTHWGWFRYSVQHALSNVLGYMLGIPLSVTIGGIYITGCGPVWFLLALAIGNVIANQLSLYFDGVKLLIASLVVASIGGLLGNWIPLPWCIFQGVVASFFICLGHFAKKNKFFTSSFNMTKLVVMIVDIIVAISLCYLGGRDTLNMVRSKYLYGPISISVMGILGLYLMHLSLYCNQALGLISTFIRKIGRESLYVLCIHTVEYVGISMSLHYELVNHWHGNVIIRSILIFGVRLVVVFLTTSCFLKWKEKFWMKK